MTRGGGVSGRVPGGPGQEPEQAAGSVPPDGRVRRRGRPAASGAAGEPPARDRIVAAARTEFAARGYDAASVRGIARRAQVDPALVHHYFGNKERVFETAVEAAFAPAMAVPDRLAAVELEDVGERMTRFVLALWEDQATREPLLAIVRSAVTNETAAGIFRGLIVRDLVSRLAEILPGPDPQRRVELAVAQLVGTVLLRHVIRIEPLASVDVEALVARIAPVVQRHLVADPPV